MGTPEFAVASLKALLEAGLNVVAVITAPDKPAGRGLQMHQSAVKEFAIQHQLPVLQPEKLRAPEFIDQLKALQPQLQVVVAFRMLPELVWSLPPLGTINLHGSLLPQYRGAAPINWAVINGEITTGVTTFQLQHQIDTGNILLKEEIAITNTDTAGTLHDKMKVIGAGVLVTTVKGILNGNLAAVPQPDMDDTLLKHAPKINPEHCNINFKRPVMEVYNQVRGLSPYPGAFTLLNDKTFKIYTSSAEITTPAHLPGEYISDGKTFLKFACADGYLLVQEIQLQGKKRMSITDFLRGYRF